MAHFKALLVSIFLLAITTDVICKIVLPHKLRYLENMLNSEVIAKAAKLRQQRIDGNTVSQLDPKKAWPLLLAKYEQEDKKKNVGNLPYTFYGRRIPSV